MVQFSINIALLDEINGHLSQ